MPGVIIFCTVRIVQTMGKMEVVCQTNFENGSVHCFKVQAGKVVLVCSFFGALPIHSCVGHAQLTACHML